MSRGGPRPGSGRKPGPTKIKLNLSLSASVVAWLRRQKNYSRVVDEAIRREMEGEMKIYIEDMDAVNSHHLPEGCYDPIRPGMTLRQALKALREVGPENFGSIGGAIYQLSDNSILRVENPSTGGDGAYLMGAQEIVRYRLDGAEKIVKKYEW